MKSLAKLAACSAVAVLLLLDGCGSEEEEEKPVPLIDGSRTPEVESPAYTPGVLDEDLYISLQAELAWSRERLPAGEVIDPAPYYERYGVTADEVEAFGEDLEERGRDRAVETQIYRRLDELRSAEGVELQPPTIDQTAETFEVDPEDGSIELTPPGE